MQKGRKREPAGNAPASKKAKSQKPKYPQIDHAVETNPVTFERHKTALENELGKPRPRKEVIVELMRHAKLRIGKNCSFCNNRGLN